MDGEEGIIGTLVPAVGDGLWRKVLAIGFHGSVCAGAFLGIVSCANCYTESRCLLWVPFTTLGSVPTGYDLPASPRLARGTRPEKAPSKPGTETSVLLTVSAQSSLDMQAQRHHETSKARKSFEA